MFSYSVPKLRGGAFAQAGGLPCVRGSLPTLAVTGEWGNLPGVRGTLPTLAVTGERGQVAGLVCGAPNQPAGFCRDGAT